MTFGIILDYDMMSFDFLWLRLIFWILRSQGLNTSPSLFSLIFRCLLSTLDLKNHGLKTKGNRLRIVKFTYIFSFIVLILLMDEKDSICLFTYLHILLNTIEAKEVRTVFIFASDQVIDTLCAPALVTLIKSEMTRFLSVFPKRTWTQLNDTVNMWFFLR